MSEQERAARIEQLEQEIWQRELELSRLRKAGSKRHFGDLIGIAQGMLPDLTAEDFNEWKYSFDESWLDDPSTQDSTRR